MTSLHLEGVGVGWWAKETSRHWHLQWNSPRGHMLVKVGDLWSAKVVSLAIDLLRLVVMKTHLVSDKRCHILSLVIYYWCCFTYGLLAPDLARSKTPPAACYCRHLSPYDPTQHEGQTQFCRSCLDLSFKWKYTPPISRVFMVFSCPLLSHQKPIANDVKIKDFIEVWWH